MDINYLLKEVNRLNVDYNDIISKFYELSNERELLSKETERLSDIVYEKESKLKSKRIIQIIKTFISIFIITFLLIKLLKYGILANNIVFTITGVISLLPIVIKSDVNFKKINEEYDCELELSQLIDNAVEIKKIDNDIVYCQNKLRNISNQLLEEINRLNDYYHKSNAKKEPIEEKVEQLIEKDNYTRKLVK